MEAIFQVKNVYGNEMTYPVNDAAKLLTALTRKKTVDKTDLLLIKSLGYNVIIK